MQTKVIWPSYHSDAINRHYWDQGLLEDTFKRGDFIHENDFNNIQPDEGAIVVLNGRMHVDDTGKINEDIAKLRWVLFIITGDEEALFPWREIKHPIMKVWVQLPRMTEHNDASFKLPNGYRPNTRQVIAETGKQKRLQDWFFAGQVNHERREQCLQELVYLTDSGEVPNGIKITTEGFGQEKITYEEYIKQMARSKIVLCPSGIESPDTFRLYEALEAGCLPIVDAFSTNFKTAGFWNYIFGEVPFPIVDYWDKLPALMPQLLKEYPSNVNKVFAWWQMYKRNLYYRLIDDVQELSK